MTHPEPLSDERLAAMKERAEKATPGPWGADKGRVDHAGAGYILKEAVPVIWNGVIGWQPDRQIYDAEFAAEARQDIPALLTEVDRLKTENQRLREKAGEA